MSRFTLRLEETVALVLVLSAVVFASTGTLNRDSAPSAPASPAASAVTTSVFLPVETPSGTKLIEQKLRVPGNVEPRMATLNYLLAHSKILPKSTRVLGLFLDKDHVLTIEFSPELKKFASGSTQEALTLAALSATIARFDGVKSFRLTVLNRPVTNLGGHVDLSEPYPAEKALPEEFR